MRARVAWPALVLAAVALEAASAPAAGPDPITSIRITSPLGRTGVPGVIRVVAQVVTAAPAGVVPVRFFVDDRLLGEDLDGPPYVTEWEDENPYEPRVIRAVVEDGRGGVVEDHVSLASLEVIEEASVTVASTRTDATDASSITSREASETWSSTIPPRPSSTTARITRGSYGFSSSHSVT